MGRSFPRYHPNCVDINKSTPLILSFNGDKSAYFIKQGSKGSNITLIISRDFQRNIPFSVRYNLKTANDPLSQPKLDILIFNNYKTKCILCQLLFDIFVANQKTKKPENKLAKPASKIADKIIITANTAYLIEYILISIALSCLLCVINT